MAYKAIKLSLFFDKKYSYIVPTPSFVFLENTQLLKDERKLFADWFNMQINSEQPNLNVYTYISNWMEKLLGKVNYKTDYPINSSTGFSFLFVPNTALIDVNFGQKFTLKYPSTINDKRFVFKGVEYKDPDLAFFDPVRNQITYDFHPLRGVKNYAPVDFALNKDILRSSISLGVICPINHEKYFFKFISQINHKIPTWYNIDFVIPFPGFYQAFKTGINIPEIRSSQWITISFPDEKDKHTAANKFAEEITRKIDQLSASSVDVILIYIPEEYEILTKYDQGVLNFDLHDYVKAYAAQKQISTQFIRERTVKSNMTCQIMWALSLAIYVKSGRIPWIVSGIQNDTAFAGIGYSVKMLSSGSNIVIGCSHVYSSDGQGLKYKLSKIQDVTFDGRKNPYLSENEAYRIGLNIKELFYKSFSELPKRVVIHKRTPFTQKEITGFVDSLSSAGIKDIDMLEITYEDDFKCFAFNNNASQIDIYPVKRGLCFPINDNTMYLYTHGIASSVINRSRRYFQGKRAIPLPLKIVKHYGNGNIAQISTEILGLSKMNWNSFGLYSKLPCTIESSNEIARIGWLLSQYEGALYEYRFFM